MTGFPCGLSIDVQIRDVQLAVLISPDLGFQTVGDYCESSCSQVARKLFKLSFVAFNGLKGELMAHESERTSSNPTAGERFWPMTVFEPHHGYFPHVTNLVIDSLVP